MDYLKNRLHGRPLALGIAIILLLFAAPSAWQQLNRYYYYEKSDKLLRRGSYTNAIATINVLLEFLPSDEVGLYLRALAKYNLKDFRGAIGDLDKILDIKPFAFQPRILRAACRNAIHLAAEAMEDVNVAKEIRPNDHDLSFLAGITHFTLKEYSAAIREFSATIQRSPSNTNAWINRGISHLLEHDTAAAIADFTQAARIDPYKENPRIHLSRIHYMQHDTSLAVANLHAALAIAPNSPDALLIKALIKHDTGQLDSAILTLSHVIALANRSSIALYNRALMRLENHEPLLALQDYRNALEISPNNVILLYNIAALYLQLEQPQRALPHLERATELFPGFAKAQALKGHALYALGKNRMAKQALDSAELLYNQYKRGKLDSWSDTSAQFSRLLAFENDFGPNEPSIITAFEKVTELMPLANIQVGHLQPYKEWPPVMRVDSLCGAPFFALSIPSDDSSKHLDISLLPPLRNAYAITLIEARALADKNRYSQALSKLQEIPEKSPIRPLANVVKANILIDSLRYAPSHAIVSPRGGSAQPAHADTSYNGSILILSRETARCESPYLHYAIATAYYLQRNLPAADSQLTLAISQNPAFAEAIYNRGLVRLLQQRQNEACIDLSVAGQLGIDQAYKAIADHCNK